MEDLEKFKKYTPYIPTPDVREHQGEIPENAGEYKDPTGQIDAMKQIEKLNKDIKACEAAIYRIKNLVAAGGRGLESPGDLEEQLREETGNLKSLKEQETKLKRDAGVN